MQGPACHETSCGNRVLVVDDHPALRDVVRDVLEIAGCEVAEADTVEGALAELAQAPVSVLVTDIYMDGNNPVGLDLIAKVRQIAPMVRVVAVSGGGNCIDGCDPLEVARKCGAQACLRKPFSASALLQAVGGADCCVG